MLDVRGLHAGYGHTPILFGLSLVVREGETVALLGKNGMGKTTLMKTIMGFLKPTAGAIDFQGRDLTRLTPHEVAHLGIGYVPENRRIFPGLTVRENLELGLSAVGAPAPPRAPAPPSSGRRAWRKSSGTSLASRSGWSSRARPCPVASSRCWRSHA
jgi:branched-chain amino acid transport system ATP-binding protein